MTVHIEAALVRMVEELVVKYDCSSFEREDIRAGVRSIATAARADAEVRIKALEGALEWALSNAEFEDEKGLRAATEVYVGAAMANQPEQVGR